MKNFVTILLVSLYTALSYSQTERNKIIGQYCTDTKEGKIEIFKKGDIYYGKIIWRKDTRLDTKNPDKNLLNRSVVGIVFMKDFVFENKKWIDGEINSIENGNTYSGKMWLENNGKTLKMKGYNSISLLGKTATFTTV